MAAGTRHGPVRVVRGDDRREPDREAARLLEDHPAERARERRTEACERRIGRRTGCRGEVAERRRRPSSSATHRRASHHPSSVVVGLVMPAAQDAGHRLGPRARAETRGRAEGVDLARAEDSPSRSAGRLVLFGRRVFGGRCVGGVGGRLDGASTASRRLASPLLPRDTERSGRRAGSAARRRSRRRSTRPRPGGSRPRPRSRGGASRGGLRASGSDTRSGRRGPSPSSYSPLIHDISRLRDFVLAACVLRTIACESIAVTPGTRLSPSPISVAPHDGHVTSESDGNCAEHHMQRGSGADAPDVASSTMAITLPRQDQRGIPRWSYLGPMGSRSSPLDLGGR